MILPAVDEPFSHQHLSTSSTMFSRESRCDEDDLHFLSNTFPPPPAFSACSIDTILHEFTDDHNPSTATARNNNSSSSSITNEVQFLDSLAQTLLLHHSSPPHPRTQSPLLSHLGYVDNGSGLADNYHPVLPEVPPLLGFESSSTSYDSNLLGNGGCQSFLRFLQSIDGKTGFSFQPRVPNPAFLLPQENGFPNGQVRRPCSNGDSPGNPIKRGEMQCLSSLVSESTLIEEPNFRVGKYSAEERKEKIDRYRAKRNQRNFNKTIKYACRKTLADNRPRVRGRFARNDDHKDNPKLATYYEEDCSWMAGKGMQGAEDEERMGMGMGMGKTGGGGHFLSIFGGKQLSPVQYQQLQQHQYQQQQQHHQHQCQCLQEASTERRGY